MSVALQLLTLLTSELAQNLQVSQEGKIVRQAICSNCVLTIYLPISVDPDRCWPPNETGPPVLPFLTCEEEMERVRATRQ